MTKNKIILLLTTLLIILSIISVYKLKSKNRYYQKVISTMRIEHEKATLDYSVHSQAINPVCKEILIKDKNNFDILLMKGDEVSDCIAQASGWEPHLQNVLKQLIKPKDKAVVLGSHIGIHAVLISKLVGNEGQVFIFEANPNVLKFLRANLALNNLYNSIIYPKAVFSKNTTISFVAESQGNTGMSHITRSKEDGQNSKMITVEAVNLDSLNEIKTIDVLQMDIEGAEPEAIYGAKKLIDNSPNLIVFQEWSPFWISDVDTYLKFWRSRNYKIAQITDVGLREMSDEQLKSSGQIDIILAKNLEEIINKFQPL